ncbi:MAG: hypothetical protein AAGD10_17540 [Myxococcota bacterium]
MASEAKNLPPKQRHDWGQEAVRRLRVRNGEGRAWVMVGEDCWSRGRNGPMMAMIGSGALEASLMRGPFTEGRAFAGRNRE